MTWIDRLIVIIPALLIGGLAVGLQRHVRSVAAQAPSPVFQTASRSPESVRGGAPLFSNATQGNP